MTFWPVLLPSETKKAYVLRGSPGQLYVRLLFGGDFAFWTHFLASCNLIPSDEAVTRWVPRVSLRPRRTRRRSGRESRITWGKMAKVRETCWRLMIHISYVPSFASALNLGVLELLIALATERSLIAWGNCRIFAFGLRLPHYVTSEEILSRLCDTTGLHHKGPSIYDVRKIFGFFDPPPFLSAFGSYLQY